MEQELEPEEPVEGIEDQPEAAAVEDDAPAPKEWSDEDEAEAKFFGWKSREDWKGQPPQDFKDDPREYLDRVKSSRTFRAMEERAQQIAQEHAARVEKVMRAKAERDLKAQKEAHDREIARFEAAKRKAVEEGDVDRYDQLDRMQKEIKPPEPPIMEDEPQPREDPVAPLASKHPWVSDPYLRTRGAEIVQAALERGLVPGGNPEAQVAFAEQELRKYYPHAFAEPEREKPKPRVEGGSLASRQASAFDKLPREARETFARQVKQGIFSDTKEDREFFAAEYHG